MEKMDGKFEETKQGWESWRMKSWEHFRERKRKRNGNILEKVQERGQNVLWKKKTSWKVKRKKRGRQIV